jgi:hypothetical protein
METSDGGYHFQSGVLWDAAAAVSCPTPSECVAVGQVG